MYGVSNWDKVVKVYAELERKQALKEAQETTKKMSFEEALKLTKENGYK